MNLLTGVKCLDNIKAKEYFELKETIDKLAQTFQIPSMQNHFFYFNNLEKFLRLYTW